MFQARSYNDVRTTISGANVTFVVAFLILTYLFVLTPSHKQAFADTLEAIRLDPVIGSVITIGLLAAVWGYLTTALIRLHDRLYEPHLVDWRASYDTDFILRSLCFPYPHRVSPRFFHKAFSDKGARHAFMQRLFYKFVGDTKGPHAELLERFYTVIRNYWLLVLAEVYCLGFLIVAMIYYYAAGHPSPPLMTPLTVLIVSLFLRIWANRYLPSIRPITIEQVGAILHEHRGDFEKELDSVLIEYQLHA